MTNNFSEKMKKHLEFLLYGMHGLPLLLKIPHSLNQLMQAFLPLKKNNSSNFYAFGTVDVGFRSWYNKISRDYKALGRFGYAWDDGLGIPMGPRIYNNLITYFLLHILGSRRMMAIGYLMMLIFPCILNINTFNIWVGLIFSFIISCSPLLIGFYTHQGKPENFWWGLGLLFLYFVLNFPGFGAGLLWSFLAFVNLPISIMLALFLGPALLYKMISLEVFLPLLLGILPGALKHIYRGVSMIRSGYFNTLVSYQASAWKRPGRPQLEEVVLWIPFILAMSACMVESHSYVLGIILSFTCIGLHWMNHRIFFLNDDENFRFAFWIIAFGFAVISQSLLGMIFSLLITYSHPLLCGFPKPIRNLKKSGSMKNIVSVGRYQFEKFPDFQIISWSIPEEIENFFNHIPDSSRIMAEPDGDPRSESQFRFFWQYMEEYLPKRNIDQLYEEYTNYSEPDLVRKYLIKIEDLEGKQINTICNKLGVAFIISYSQKMCATLKRAGFNLISEVSLENLKDFSKTLKLPSVTLSLWKNPTKISVIDPITKWVRIRNELSWDAKSKQEYIIKYRYDKQFRALQNNYPLEIEKYYPFSDIDLKFMRVRAMQDGKITLAFRANWI